MKKKFSYLIKIINIIHYNLMFFIFKSNIKQNILIFFKNNNNNKEKNIYLPRNIIMGSDALILKVKMKHEIEIDT